MYVANGSIVTITTTRAVILARGLGTRMRKTDDAASLSPAQAAAADTGVKGMIPIGRPFMDFLISALADAGLTDVIQEYAKKYRKATFHAGKRPWGRGVRFCLSLCDTE